MDLTYPRTPLPGASHAPARHPATQAHASGALSRPNKRPSTATPEGAPEVAGLEIPAAAEKQKPNFAATGKLAGETNTVAGTSVVLKYNEPPELRNPPTSAPWRLYVFKGSQTLETIELGTQSCWLFGRERSVVDCAMEHPSCSKQHAVLQFQYVKQKNEYGDREGGVRPYVIDLDSANGTRVNGRGCQRGGLWR